MKFVAQIQKLHRVTIPYAVWDAMGLKENQFVNMEVDKNVREDKK